MIIKKPLQYAIIIDKQGDYGVFDTMNDAINSASVAGKKYSELSIEKKQDILNSLNKELKLHIEEITKMFFEETGIGAYGDNLIKNTKVLNEVLDIKHLDDISINSNSTDEDFENMVTGVVVPLEDSIITLINYSISSIISGNAVVFSSHPSMKKTFAYIIKLINKTIENAKGPKNLIVTVKEPSIENTNIMLNHDNVIESSFTNYYSEKKIAL